MPAARRRRGDRRGRAEGAAAASAHHRGSDDRGRAGADPAGVGRVQRRRLMVRRCPLSAQQQRKADIARSRRTVTRTCTRFAGTK